MANITIEFEVEFQDLNYGVQIYIQTSFSVFFPKNSVTFSTEKKYPTDIWTSYFPVRQIRSVEKKGQSMKSKFSTVVEL